MLIMVIPVSKDEQRIQVVNRFNCSKARKGSITLEMSICLSIFLIVVYFMISAFSAIRLK
jgi:Flp pilus assembly protein TadG